MNLTSGRIRDFISALERVGGGSGNKSLRQMLNWDEDFPEAQAGKRLSLNQLLAKERVLYAPLKVSIEKWIRKFALDDVLVDETHSRGSKHTGGTFTRPDITAVGIRSYRFLPKRLEVITFEVKPPQSVSILGVLEANRSWQKPNGWEPPDNP